MKKLCYAIVFGVLLFPELKAQETNISLVKPEVPESQTMFKRTVWRRMDLREKQNRPFFSTNGELPRLLLKAVEEGLLKPYQTDSTLRPMADSTFKSNIQVEIQGGGFDSFDSGFGGGGFGDESAQTAQSSGPKYDPIPASVFDVVYLKEDVIFDRNRSRMYWYIRTISLALPGRAGSTWNPAGFEKMVAHFKYEDVMSLFRGPYADKAVWYNNQNQAAHRNYADSFELRLFSAPIVKISNADNLDIRQMENDPFKAVLLQQQMEYELLDYESQLWEY